MTAPSRPPAAVVIGLGAYLPPDVVTNGMLAERLDTTDEWIFSRTGIRERHVVAGGVATSDLAVEAGARALRSAELAAAGRPAAGSGSGSGTGSDGEGSRGGRAATGTGGQAAQRGADMVVLATTTPDHPCPASAPDVAFRLGLGGVPAFDVGAVCAGFVYALGMAAGAIAAGLAERVLVIGAEAFTTIIDPADRTSAAIFGDGAGAVVLRAGTADEPGALLAIDLGSDGEQRDLIRVPAGGSRQRTSGRSPEPHEHFFAMQGKAVFRHAVDRMAGSLRAVLTTSGWATDDVDWLVGHQANVRILHMLADQLELPRPRAVVNIDRVGNTSAASIPLALADAVAAGAFTAGDRIALTAFGGGLTWGSAVLTWGPLQLA